MLSAKQWLVPSIGAHDDLTNDWRAIHLRAGAFCKRADRDDNRRKLVLPLRALGNAETASGRAVAINAMLGIISLITRDDIMSLARAD